jgi:hypothetical protein
MEYTVFPAVLLAGAVVAVIAKWNPAAPLTGGWTVRELALGPGLALLGIALVAAASVAQRARETAVHPAPAWIPPVMMLIGLAALIVGVLTLGRTVKRTASKRTVIVRGARSSLAPRLGYCFAGFLPSAQAGRGNAKPKEWPNDAQEPVVTPFLVVPS